MKGSIFENVTANEYRKIFKMALGQIKSRLPSDKEIDTHDLAHQAVEYYYSHPAEKPYIWYCVVDAVRKYHGGLKNRAFLRNIDDHAPAATDPGFEALEINDSIMYAYKRVEHLLKDLEKRVFWALMNGKTMAELARDTEYTESYYSYIRRDLMKRLRSGFNQTTR